MSKTFLRGLAAVLPLALTLYVFWWLGTTAEAALGALVRALLPEGTYVPGLGVVLGFALVFALGVMLQTWLVRSLWARVEGVLQRIPLVKTVFGSVKDLMIFIAKGDQQRELDQVVMVSMGEPPLRLIGLVTSDNARDLTGREQDESQVAVYLPMSYQIGGFMVLVDRAAIEPVDLGVEEALRMIVTAGLSGQGASNAKPGAKARSRADA